MDMYKGLNIDLELARKVLADDTATHVLIDSFSHISEQCIKDLEPLMFDVINMDTLARAPWVLSSIAAKCPQWLNIRNKSGDTPLMCAVGSNRIDLVEILLDAGAKTNPRNNNGWGVLCVAAYLKLNHRWQQAMSDALLEKGNFTQKEKDLALHRAASQGNLGMIRSLLANGAGFGARNDERSVLSSVSFLDEHDKPVVDIMRHVLATEGGKATIDEGWGNPDFGPAVNGAASQGNNGALAVLIQAGASLDAPAHIGPRKATTPLMTAAYYLELDTIDLLIKAGANPNAIDADGRNVLHHLAGADQDFLPGDHDNTRLLLKALTALVEAGADPCLEDNDGNLPCDIARSNISLTRPEVLADALGAMVSSSSMTRHTPDAAGAPGAQQGPRL